MGVPMSLGVDKFGTPRLSADFGGMTSPAIAVWVDNAFAAIRGRGPTQVELGNLLALLFPTSDVGSGYGMAAIIASVPTVSDAPTPAAWDALQRFYITP